MWSFDCCVVVHYSVRVNAVPPECAVSTGSHIGPDSWTSVSDLRWSSQGLLLFSAPGFPFYLNPLHWVENMYSIQTLFRTCLFVIQSNCNMFPPHPIGLLTGYVFCLNLLFVFSSRIVPTCDRPWCMAAPTSAIRSATWPVVVICLLPPPADLLTWWNVDAYDSIASGRNNNTLSSLANLSSCSLLLCLLFIIVTSVHMIWYDSDLMNEGV